MTRFFRVALLVSLMVFVATVIGVSAYLERRDVRQPDDSLNQTTSAPTATPQPTRTAEPQNTATPGPDFAAMQRTIDEQVAELNEQRNAFYADIERDALEAATEKAREELNQLRRMYDVDYSLKLEELEHQRTTNAEEERMQLTLQAGILYKNEQLTASEIRAAQKIDEWNALVQVGWLTLWRGLVLVGMVVIIALVAAYVARRNNYEAEWLEVTERHRAEIERMEALAMDRAAAYAARISKLSRFVAEAVSVAGRDDHQVPSNTKMPGYHARQWQDVIDVLKADGAVEAVEGVGTFVRKPYTDLGGLLDAIESGEYHG